MRKRFLQLAMAALVAVPSFYASAEITGTGSEKDPYLIGSADDLCNAYTKMSPGEYVYFKQTADIDMAGVEKYTAINGSNGDYSAGFNYEGDYHVIKNFAPKDRSPFTDNGYYCTSIFGVLSGQVQHLGVVNANIETAQGAGIFCAYLGSSKSNYKFAVIENCFAQGTVNCTGSYAGGFAGTTDDASVSYYLQYSFAQVDVTSAGYGGGLIGRTRAAVPVMNVYYAGKVKSADNYGLLFSTDKTGISLTLTNVVGFGEGPLAPESLTIKASSKGYSVAAPYDADAIATIQSWSTFSEKDKMFNGYPAFTWDMFAPGTELNPYKIATAEDLCNAYTKMVAGKKVYFVQTADIDMKGVTDYTCLNGFNGLYTSAFEYDGQNHTISNFKPYDKAKDGTVLNTNNSYCTSLFGVISGKVSNLGVIDANIESVQGVGVLGAYLAHGDAAALAKVSVIENCFVTGSVKATGNYAGALVGTNSGVCEINNCYALVDVESNTKAAAGIVGRLRGKGQVTVNNTYFAGTVKTGAEYGLLFSTDKAAADGVYANLNDVVGFGQGPWAPEFIVTASAETVKNVTVTDAGDVAAVAAIQTWEAFNEKKMYNGYPALNWQVIKKEADGSQENPYEIATPEDLCNAYTKMVAGKKVYFVQTADIDMKDVTDYTCLNGFNGLYTSAFEYDGQNHVIRNFKPYDKAKDGTVLNTNNSYCTSLFGVISGKVSNLGVIDANIESVQGVGVLGAYLAHGDAAALAKVSVIENCFVTGTVKATGNYAGALVGTNSGVCEINNCYALVDVESNTKAAAGIVGRLRGKGQVTVNNTYFAGTVKTGAEYGLLFSTDKAAADGVYANLNDVVGFGQGPWAPEFIVTASAETVKNVTVAPEKDAAAIAQIQSWDAFNQKKFNTGYPALNWQDDDNSAVEAIFNDQVIDENAPVEYYNLSGVRVANPTPGIYIMKQGNKVSKVVVR